MPIVRATLGLAAMAVAFAGEIAFAQPVAPVTLPPPPSWMVSPDPARGLVQIGKTSMDGTTRFTGGCNRLAGQGLIGSFSRYMGARLRADGEKERVLFYVSGADWQEAFAAQLRYVASSGSWEIVSPLAPVFVNSFSRGGRLTVRNGQLEEVFSFDLTGSTAAARTMRSVCGFE